MKRYTLLLIFLCSAANIISQTHSLGVQGGINFSDKVSGSNFGIISGFTGIKMGFIGGLKYEMILSDRHSIGADILYNPQGYDITGKNFDDQYISMEYNYNYLSIPIKYGYIVGQKVKFTPKIGLQPSILLSAKRFGPIFNENGTMIGNETTDIENLSKINLGVILEFELGVVFDEIEFFGLLSNQYLISTNSGYYSLSFSFGLKYRLHKD